MCWTLKRELRLSFLLPVFIQLQPSTAVMFTKVRVSLSFQVAI
ncbi:Uncharacterised protein [Shewanella baltica]|nr:Uncharacterised protein [Shewanella baltica]